ncbi:MAG: undecaprenyl diphosphate synthase family protein [Methanophagales archaeon]|nr:undecaprenyl diphosphate synthase family protein [Methanophagales archaeon]
MSLLSPVIAIYEKILKREVLNSQIGVNHILLVLDESDLLPDGRVSMSISDNTKGLKRLKLFIKWCDSLRIDVISIYISVIREGVGRKLLDAVHRHLKEAVIAALSDVDVGASIAVYTDSSASARFINGSGRGGVKRINVSIGMGGRSELTKAVREIAKHVESGEIEPDEIDEKMIEANLIFKSEPDLVIRSGATRLTDFLIWQSVYSEFYFTDVNWQNFRKIDLLRAVRDFQLRERRFGR